jgi:hypothetical protein
VVGWLHVWAYGKVAHYGKRAWCSRDVHLMVREAEMERGLGKHTTNKDMPPETYFLK